MRPGLCELGRFQDNTHDPGKRVRKVIFGMDSIILKTVSAVAAITFLVNVGQAVLKDTHSTDWMLVDEVAAVAKEKGILLDQEVSKPKEIEQQLRPLFAVNDEVFKDGIQVIGMEHRIGWDLMFMLRFYRCNPVHHPKTAIAVAA